MNKRNRNNVELDHNPNGGKQSPMMAMYEDQFGGYIEEVFEGSAIALNDDGSISVSGFNIHHLGVEIDNDVAPDMWERFGFMLAKMQNALTWIIADWLAYGDASYGDKVYERASEILGKSPATWEDYAYIARNVKFSERSENLSLKHHKLVATYTPDKQIELLSLADEYSLSTRSFETIIPIYLDGRDWQLLLPEQLGAIGKAKIKFENERMKIRDRANKKDGDKWIKFAKEQAREWQRLVDEFES